jgi:hypothetical protein
MGLPEIRGHGAISAGAGSALAAGRGITRLWLISPSAWLIGLATVATVSLRLIPLYLPAADIRASTFIHERATADLLQSDPSAARLGPRELKTAVDWWIGQHADTLLPLERQAAQSIREAFTFEGEDGAQHVYLGDEDGYYWMKLARSVLAHGTVCDRIEDGSCIDALANAPVGQPIEYTDSPHVYAIAAFHWLATRLRPGFPLSSSAMLVPLTLSALMALPAFFLARQASNIFGGLMAVLLLSFNATVFFRTVDADDDIWIVALPVLSMSLITAAFGRERLSARILLSALGGVVLALHAAAWKGWPLFGLSMLAGLIGIAAWALLTALIARTRGHLALAQSAGLCTFSAAAGFAAVGWLLRIQIDIGGITGQLSSMAGRVAAAPSPIDTAPMPDVFHFVSELAAVNAAELQQSIGPFTLGLGWLGFALVLWAPRARRGFLVLALAVVLAAIAALFGRYGAGRTAVLAVPVFLALAAVGANWLGRTSPSDRAAATGILGLAWLGAALWMSFEGQRFILLAIAPLSMAAGISLGHVAAAVTALGVGRAPLLRGAGLVGAGGLAAAAFGPVAIGGLEQATAHAPTVNSAWTGAFATIRAQSGSDAIVDIWWDYGHWAKYFSERAVVLDGALLQSRAVHWMGRTLAAASDAEAIGLLRLMNCGMVADPDGGPPARPYDMLLRWSADPGLAFRSFMELARLTRAQAADFLRAAGLPDARAAALLRTANCAPPQSYLVLTTEMLDTRGWLVSGLWDPGLAHIAELARRSTADAALPIIEEKYGLPKAKARGLYASARRVRTEEDRIAFAAPQAQTWSRDWQLCVQQGDTLHCPLELGDFAIGAHLQDMVVDLQNPERTRIRVVRHPGEEALEETPAMLELAQPDRLQDIPLADATVELAVLVDPDQQRVFVGTPRVVRSTLVRLVLLDGRYSPQFHKIYDQLGIDRNRITVWQLVWGQR